MRKVYVWNNPGMTKADYPVSIDQGDSRGVCEFWVNGHLGIILGSCSYMLKTLLRLHDSIDFDETWSKRSLARGSFGVFRNF